MPPFLSSIRSRTNSLLDTITGVIPDAPPNGTFKDRSLTCRKCGNRFRDRLELGSHFNLFPHHSDYKDAHDYDSFVRPKVRRPKIVDAISDSTNADGAPTHPILPATGSFSEAQAYYAVQEKDKENRPAILRKFPTLTNLSTNVTGEQLSSALATDYGANTADASRSSTKAKGKQRAMPCLRRDDSFLYGQPLASSDEDEGLQAPVPSFKARARSQTLPGFSSEHIPQARPRTSVSSVASTSSAGSRQAPPLPPKLPLFDWQQKRATFRSSLQPSADDSASLASEASYRTAGSAEREPEKAQLKAYYARNESAEEDRKGTQPSSSPASKREEKQKDAHLPPWPRTRHASESNLLLESTSASYDDAPPSYHELHGDTDPFDDLAGPSRHASRSFASRSDGFATVPASPVSRNDHSLFQRPRRSTNAWPSTSGTGFPVRFSPFDDLSHSNENDLYNASGKEKGRTAVYRPALKSKSTDASLPPLVSSSSFSSIASPSSPRTPFAFFADAPLTSPPLSLPRPLPSPKSTSGAGRRNRHTSRSKSDAAPSTRCPTCFAKFASLEKTLEHLDSSDCGAVEFESGIM